MVTAAAPVTGDQPAALRRAVAQMAYWNDATLWQAARSIMSPGQAERLEELNHKQQREGLTSEELAERDALLRLYQETILVRARAAVLLKRRGYDVSDPEMFAPLSRVRHTSPGGCVRV